MVVDTNLKKHEKGVVVVVVVHANFTISACLPMGSKYKHLRSKHYKEL